MGMCETLMLDVMAPGNDHSCVYTLAQWTYFLFTTQEFSMVDGYTEDLKNHKTVNIGGCVLARGWVLAGTIR